jgi:hypothetical protein
MRSEQETGIQGPSAAIRRLIERTGDTIHRLPKTTDQLYDQDGLRSIHNHEFMKEALFAKT